MTSFISMLVESYDQTISYIYYSGEVAIMIYNSDDTSSVINSSINCGLQWDHLPNLGENGNGDLMYHGLIQFV